MHRELEYDALEYKVYGQCLSSCMHKQVLSSSSRVVNVTRQKVPDLIQCYIDTLVSETKEPSKVLERQHQVPEARDSEVNFTLISN